MATEEDLGDGHKADYYSDYLTSHGLRDGQPENEYELDDPMPFPRTRFPPDQVNALHANSDRDSSQLAQHHTLGPRHNQASPGDHIHDGVSSKNLGQWVVWSGANASWTAATTNPAIGTHGVIEGKYCKIGTRVEYRFTLVAGSDTTFGTGGWLFALPFPAVLPGPNTMGPALGSCHAFQGSNANFTGVVCFNDANHVFIVSHAVANSWQSNTPVTWAANSNNLFGFTIVYESTS